MSLSYPTFAPSGEATLVEVLDDFARCAKLDDVTLEVPAATVEVLRKEIAREGRTEAQRAQSLAVCFTRPFAELNAVLAQRGNDLSWICFSTAMSDATSRARWYRVSAAQAREFEASGALRMTSVMRRILVGTLLAAVFYVLLWQAWSRQTVELYVATGVALAVYFFVRWRYPLKPKA